MGWDVFVQHLPAEASHASEIPDDFQPRALGVSRSRIIEAARSVGGEVDDSVPAWTVWSGAGFDIALNMSERVLDHFAMHVRGDAKNSRQAVVDLLETVGLRGLESEEGSIVG